jgi:CSLREA domain-containing protein
MRVRFAVAALGRRLAWGTVVALLLWAPAGAFVVDSTEDSPDATPGDGLCATTLGACTLRAALDEANATPGLDFVQLQDRTYSRTIAGDLDVTDDVQILGPEGLADIDARGLGRGLHVHAGVSALIVQVALRGGVTGGGSPGGSGLLNEGHATLRRVAITENVGYVGAAIHNLGQLDLEQVYVTHNGPRVAVFNEGSLQFEQGDIASNDDVGLLNRNSVRLRFVHVDRNGSTGIANNGYLEIERSVLSYNRESALSSSTAFASPATVYLKRSTVSGNTGGNASAISVSSGSLYLENTTIGANGSADSPAAALAGDPTASVGASNTIVAGNVSSSGDPDCRIPVTSLGYNLMSCPLTAPDPTTIVGDPRLGPLKPFAVTSPTTGFTTLAHGLLPGSAAIDAGSCSTPWPDQRGVDRPSGPACDIGAFEATPLCTGGVGIADARLTTRRRPLPIGTTTLKLRGRLLFSDPLSPTVNPPATGLQIRVEEAASPDGAFFERTVLTEPLNTAGWLGTPPRFRWKSVGPAPREKLVVTVKDRRAVGGGVEVKLAGTGMLPPATGPLRVTVVLGGDLLGGNEAGDAGACAEQVFTCTSDASGLKLKCS